MHFVQVLEPCEKLNLSEMEVADMVELSQAFCVVIVVSCCNREYSDNYEHKEKNKSLKNCLPRKKSPCEVVAKESIVYQPKRDKDHQKETSHFALGQ